MIYTHIDNYRYIYIYISLSVYITYFKRKSVLIQSKDGRETLPKAPSGNSTYETLMKIALKVDDLPHVIMLALRLTRGIDSIDIIIANHYLRTVRNQPPNLRSLDFTHFAGLLCAKPCEFTQEGISSAKAPVRLKIWSCLGILQEL